MKLFYVLLDIALVLFFSKGLSLLTVRFFNIRPSFSSLTGLSWYAFFLIGGLLLWASFAPLLNVQLNFFVSDLRRFFDRLDPISTLELDQIASKVIISEQSYELDLSRSCDGEFPDDRYTMLQLTGFEAVDHVFWLEHISSIKADIDNDLQEEEIAIIACGWNHIWYVGHLFDDGSAYQINIGSSGSRLDYNNGEFILSTPGGGPRCCPTTIERRFYHYRNGTLIEHRAREIEPFKLLYHN